MILRLLRNLAAVTLLLASFSVSATLLYFTALLEGTAENPPNASPGSGLAELYFDTDLHTMQLNILFADLIGTTTAAHIHCCVAPPGNVGVASTTPFFPGFPLGVNSGNYSMLFDLTLPSTFNAAFVTNNGGTLAGAEAALLGGLMNGQAYLNIHTTSFPGGEIRGFFQTVAEPGTLSLMLLCGLALSIGRRRH